MRWQQAGGGSILGNDHVDELAVGGELLAQIGFGGLRATNIARPIM
jgi:hypothetical protein